MKAQIAKSDVISQQINSKELWPFWLNKKELLIPCLSFFCDLFLLSLWQIYCSWWKLCHRFIHCLLPCKRRSFHIKNPNVALCLDESAVTKVAKFKRNLLISSFAVTPKQSPAVHCCHRKQSTMACWRSSCDLGRHTDNLPKSECQNNSVDIRWQSHPKVEDAGNRWKKLFTTLVSCCVPRFVGMSLDELFIFLNSAPLFVPASESLFSVHLFSAAWMNLHESWRFFL